MRARTPVALVVAAVLGAAGLFAVATSFEGRAAGPSSTPPPGAENSSVLLFNAGAASASVVLSYYAADGDYLTGDACPGESSGTVSCTTQLSPGQSFRFDQYYNRALGDDYRGSGTIASDQPLETLVIKNIEDTSRGKPSFLSYAIENAPSAAYLRLAMPYLPYKANGWSSRFTVQNSSDRDAACVVINYRDRSGGRATSPAPGLVPSKGRCPKGGWAILPLGTLVATPGFQVMKLPAGFDGGAYIESIANADGRKAAIVGEGDVYLDGSRAFDSYAAQGLAIGKDGRPKLGDPTDDFARVVTAPWIQRNALDGPGTPWTTRVRLISADPSRGLTVAARYVGTGPSKGRRVTCRIAVKGSGDDAHCRLPSGFTGFATFRSSIPISAVVERRQLATGAYARYGTYMATPKGPTTSDVDLPLVTSDYWTGWTSRVRILSLDGEPATVDIELIPRVRDSCIDERQTKRIRLTEAAFTLSFAARGYYSPWPRGAPGGCFYGALRIEADRPIVAVSSLTLLGYRGDIEAMYRGFPVPSPDIVH